MSLWILRQRAAAGIWSSGGGGGGRMMSSSTTNIDPSRICPWLVLPPAASEDGAAYKLYSIASKKVVSFKKEAAPPPCAEGLVRLVGSSHGWLASFNFDNQHIFLSNPITSGHMNLPSIHTLPQSSLFNRPHTRTAVEKIILSSSPAASDDDCRAVMTFSARGMALCRPGAAEWIHVGDAIYEDFVYASRRKRLFCLTSDNEIECWDLDAHPPTLVSKDLISNLDDEQEQDDDDDDDDETCRYGRARHLVFAEQSDQLFLVSRVIQDNTGPDGSHVESIYLGLDRGLDNTYPYQTSDFDVHEIDWERRKVRHMNESLNGLSMFVGNNHAFAAEFPELKVDSIYFTDAQEYTPLHNNNGNFGGHDIGIFNYVDKSFSSVYYSCRASQITRILPPPIWLTPNPH